MANAKRSSKKAASKKATSKKAASKKATSKKAASKKAAPKKATSKKAAPNSVSAGRARMDLYRAVRHGTEAQATHARAVLREAEAAQARARGWNDVEAAIVAGDEARLRSLVAGGVSVAVSSPYGSFPLALAAQQGRTVLVRTLLELGANVDQVDFERETALFRAAHGGHAEIAEVLLSAGARTDLRSQFGLTPADKAARAGHATLAARLSRAS